MSRMIDNHNEMNHEDFRCSNRDSCTISKTLEDLVKDINEYDHSFFE